MYQFLLNMWVMKRVTETQLKTCVAKGQINQNEYKAIIETSQK